MKYRPEIDGLRTVAVLPVLLFHLGISAFSGGFVGVDVFFVISGFLITGRIVGEIEAGHFSFREFYLARVRRIFPALFVTILLTFAAGTVVFAPGILQDAAGESITALFSISNFYFWLSSGYFDSDSSTKVLLHTWSLAVEEQFYLLWPALLVMAFWAGRTKAFVLGCLLSVGSLIAATVYLPVDPAGAFYLLPFRICELGLGGLLVWAPKESRMPNAVSEIGLLVGLAMIIAAVLTYDETTPFPGVSAMVPCAGAALSIYFGRASFSSLLLSNPLSVAIGKISYSLYLVHWPIIVLTKYVLMRDLSVSESIAVFVASFVLATLMYLFVEQPFRRKKGPVFAIAPRRLIFATACMGVVAAAPAWSAWAQDGWPWRSANEIALGISNPREFHTRYYGGRGCGLPRCETNPSATRKAYFIGDSHDRALYAGLKAIFPDVNFIIYGPNSCPFYTLTIGNHEDVHAAACLKARKQAFNEIAAGDAPVFMTHHWAARMNSTHRKDDGTGETIPRFRDADKFAAFVARELPAVQKLIGKQSLILIGGVPRYGAPSSPLDCITRPIASDSCARSSLSDSYIAAQEEINLAMKKAIDVPFIDPYDFLCDNVSCLNTDETGHPLYSDPTHLSIWGSAYLIRAMAKEIDRFLPAAESTTKPGS